MAVLQLLTPEDAKQNYRIDAARAVLGRHPDCDVVLDSAAVSRQHAQISLDGGDYYVEDLHSRNGTFVNGVMIEGRRRLEDGDQLKICDLLLAFFRNEPRGPESDPLDGFLRSSSFAIVDDEDEQDVETSNSTIMSKVDVMSSRAGVRFSVNPESKLRAMMEISNNLNRAVAVDEVLPKLLDSVFKIYLQADRAFVILRNPGGGPLIPKAVKHRRPDAEDSVRVSRTIVNQVMESKEAILSADAASDARFQSSQSIADLKIRSVMCAPLVNAEGASLGVIQIDTLDQRHWFQQDDLDLLASIASQAAIAVDNAQLHERQLKQQHVQAELELAHKVQRGILPSAPPQAPGYHFFDFYEAAGQVGGDYYDYIELPDGRIAVVVADVSGKGVSAALIMAKLSGEVRFCLASERTPAAAVDRINATFCRSGWDDKFVTFILAVLDPVKHEMTIVNAGHMAPFLRHVNAQVEEISDDGGGVPLGIDPDCKYTQITRALAPGESLTMFTDGISEAMNIANDLYGLERLQRIIGDETKSVDTLGRHILEDVKQFVGGRPQSDDMCLACFGRSA